MLPSDLESLNTFDGSRPFRTSVCYPDRYRHLDELPARYVVRGGGYSYSPASLAADRTAVDMRAFNRILRFDAATLEIEVETGITLGQLLAFLTPRGYWCPVIPGYHAITIGGCIAGDVHGKSQCRDGNFRHWVKKLWLVDPHAGGLLPCDRETDPELFELTCGGLGLTGVIARATLRITPLAGGRVQTHRQPVQNLSEAVMRLRAASATEEFAYSWHRPWCAGDTQFGAGFVFHGSTIAGSPLPAPSEFEHRPLAPDASDRLLPFAVFGGRGNWRTRGVYLGASLLETSASMMTDTLFGSLFPFVAQRHYFQLFGRTGLQEVQVLVPTPTIEEFLQELTRLCRTNPPPMAVVALKIFHGPVSGIRYDGEGLSVAMDMVRGKSTTAFLTRFDQLCLRHHARPNVLKDSRLNREIFDACYPAADEFRQTLRRRGYSGKYSSALCQRLCLA